MKKDVSFFRRFLPSRTALYDPDGALTGIQHNVVAVFQQLGSPFDIYNGGKAILSGDNGAVG